MTCGTPQQKPTDDIDKKCTSSDEIEERWETCTITLREMKRGMFKTPAHQFYVRGIGPEGPYLVAISEKWIGNASKKDLDALRIHRVLVRSMSEVGWDVIPGLGALTQPDQHNRNWYELHFRRRVESFTIPADEDSEDWNVQHDLDEKRP
jgi:hypothetical protein